MWYADNKLIQSMRDKLEEKFASTEYAGPMDVVSFLGVNDKEEQELLKQDVYQKIHYLVRKLK